MESEYLSISGIQHFSFCRRQWALIHVENAWEENILTAEGRSQHDRVHNPFVSDRRDGIITIRALPVKSEKLGINGVCDAVELIPEQDGITLSGRAGTWRVNPVEYKHGKSKAIDCDRLQLAAQCLCLEEMLCCEIKQADLFYWESRRRETVEITDELRTRLANMVTEMKMYFGRQYTPNVKPGKKCDNCSLVDICMPSLMNKKTVSDYIKNRLEEAD